VSNTSEETEKFAIRLKTARDMRELSQTALAKKAGLDPSAIGHFESDRRKPSFANVRVLAKALDVSADYLLGRSESLEGATTAFRDEDKLSSDDREWIQRLIDSKVQENKKSES